jgi:hypothetical protein
VCELELRGGQHELGIRRLQQQKVERALADVFDGLPERRLNDAREHALEQREEADDHQHLLGPPARDPVAHLEQHVEGHERGRAPEQRGDRLDHEVEPVLQREQHRRLDLDRQQAKVAPHAQPPYAAKRLIPSRQSTWASMANSAM